MLLSAAFGWIILTYSMECGELSAFSENLDNHYNPLPVHLASLPKPLSTIMLQYHIIWTTELLQLVVYCEYVVVSV